MICTNCSSVYMKVLASQKQLENKYKAADQTSNDWYATLIAHLNVRFTVLILISTFPE